MTREEAKAILAQKVKPCVLGKWGEAIDMAIEALQADAVSLTGTMKYLTKPHNYCEVVRCKDCRHRDLFSCPLADNDFQKDDDYCSWGELADKTKYPATYNTNTKCGGCVHLDELGRCLNFMLAKDDRSCWRGSWENNNGELAEQTERREK